MKPKTAWGIIGAGGIADRRTLPGMMLSENSYPVAVMETNEAKAREIAEKYGARSYYTSVDELLADNEVEAVYIASPVLFHKEQIAAAAKTHKHILCEKPICLMAADTEDVMKICRDNGVISATGFMMRYHSLHRKIKSLIESGKIGKVVSCRAQMSCWFPEIAGSWRQEISKSGGGALIDMGVHCIDVLEYVTGAIATDVFAFCETKTFSYAIEDSANAVFKMSNGATAYIDVNYNIPDKASTGRLEVFGTEGSLIAEGTLGQEDTGVLRCVFSRQGEYEAKQSRENAEKTEYKADGCNLYEREITSFSNSVLSGTPAEIPMESGLHAQLAVEAAYAASKSGKVTKIGR